MPAIVSDRLGTVNATQNIAFSEIGTLLGSVTASVLFGLGALETSIAVAGIGATVLGLFVITALYWKENRLR